MYIIFSAFFGFHVNDPSLVPASESEYGSNIVLCDEYTRITSNEQESRAKLAEYLSQQKINLACCYVAPDTIIRVLEGREHQRSGVGSIVYDNKDRTASSMIGLPSAKCQLVEADIDGTVTRAYYRNYIGSKGNLHKYTTVNVGTKYSWASRNELHTVS